MELGNIGKQRNDRHEFQNIGTYPSGNYNMAIQINFILVGLFATMHPMRKSSLTILHYEFKIKQNLVDLKLGLVGMDDAFGEILS